MITCEQRLWTRDGGWKTTHPFAEPQTPQLVLAFGASSAVAQAEHYDTIRAFYPDAAHIIMCSTAGEILGTEVRDDSISLTACAFDATTLDVVQTQITDPGKSAAVGKDLAARLPQDNLRHVLVFSDGLLVNGTTLVAGMMEALPPEVSVTGGLVGDGADFKKTFVGHNAAATTGTIVAVGLYGNALRIGYGSMGGWDSFGLNRTITRSQNNILYELDGASALGLYKEYLGDKAAELPGSGLLFPLSIHAKDDRGEESEVVRTLLDIDPKTGGMIFAGDMPEGATARMMKANFERLIDGASDAAGMSITGFDGHAAQFALLVSCIGRKMILKERTEDETDAVRFALGETVTMAGFYSYGEICPTAPTEKQCQLHNQTMTITAFYEE